MIVITYFIHIDVKWVKLWEVSNDEPFIYQILHWSLTNEVGNAISLWIAPMYSILYSSEL